MTTKPLPRPLGAKPVSSPGSVAPRPLPGKMPRPGGAASVSYEKDQQVQQSRIEELPADGGEEGPGIVGISQGLTIPGPKGSYMTARVDVFLYLPCAADLGSANRVYDRCKVFVDGKLDELAGEVKEFFSS